MQGLQVRKGGQAYLPPTPKLHCSNVDYAKLGVYANALPRADAHHTCIPPPPPPGGGGGLKELRAHTCIPF